VKSSFRKDSLNRRELESLYLDTRARLHLVGHLQCLSCWGRMGLYLRRVSRLEIEAQLQRPGSRFFKKFARSPQGLLKRMNHAVIDQDIQPLWEEDSCNLRVGFSAKVFSKGVGTDAIMALSDLDDSVKRSLKTREIPGMSFKVTVVSMDSPQVTWWANMILRRSVGRVHVITVFPGTQAPPFPDPSFQSGEKYKESEKFWSTHALVDWPNNSS